MGQFFVTLINFNRLEIKLERVIEGENRRMYRSNRNLAIVRLLLQLKTYDDEYPDGLYSVRRSYFVSLLYRVLSLIM